MNSSKKNVCLTIIKKKRQKKKLNNANLFDYSKSVFFDHKIKYIHKN